MTIRSEFNTHVLNDEGAEKAKAIAQVYSNALTELEKLCGTEGRCMAIARTKLQESAFFAKRAMVMRSENQV